MQHLSLEQKIGQLFVIGFQGTALNAEDKEHFRKHHFANFIYFARNLADYQSTAALADSLQESAQESCGVPPFITIDQEGGMVVRLYSGATHFPSNMAVTASGIKEGPYEMGKMVGTELRALGINFNLAPTLDVNNNPENPVIGIRSFSDKPEVVSKMGLAYIKGLQESGVMATAKHFPGHGDTSVDSHLGLPSIEHTMERLEKVEMLPFRAAIDGGVDVIMSAHVIFPAIDPERLPATISEKVLTGFLRGKLGFDGLIMTDAMDMEAIAAKYTAVRGAVMAIKAGADLLCMCGSREVHHGAYEALLAAVRDGEISEDRIDQSIERILRYKEKYHLNFQPIGKEQILDSYPAHEALADEISEKSITLLRDRDTLLPVSGKSTLVLSPPPVRVNLADNHSDKLISFAEYFAGISGCTHCEFSVSPDEEEIQSIVKEAAGYERVVLASYNALLYPGQIQLVKALCASNVKLIVVSLRIPYDIKGFPEAGTYIAAYEYTPRSIKNVTRVLLGQFTPTGEMPVIL